MFTSNRQNYHKSELPNIGEIGFLIANYNRWNEPQYLTGRKRRCIVESFPLCDNVLPYSKGIHTVTVRFLDNNERCRVSGFYFTA